VLVCAAKRADGSEGNQDSLLGLEL
jgi:hypothetical protein